MSPFRRGESAAFWDSAARVNAAWYIATSHTAETPEFFAHGAAETDALLRVTGVEVRPDHTLLEIGCGVGRMTQRLAELAGRVIATDVSAEMLARARRNLADRPNVTLIQIPGDGGLPCIDRSVDVVFSYITMQHVPSAEAQLRYLDESVRLLRPGGRAAIQLRASGPTARGLDWAGHLGHAVRGRRTLAGAWRGARLPPDALRRLARDDLWVEIRHHTRRHIWFIASRGG